MFEDDDGPALPPGHMIDAEEVESTTSLPLSTPAAMRSRALSTQAKLDQLEKQRELSAKAKMAKRATAGMVAKNDGPAVAERKGLRMVSGSEEEDEDDESIPEPAVKRTGSTDASKKVALLTTDRGASITALSANRKTTAGLTNAEKKLQLLGLSTEVDHSEGVDKPAASANIQTASQKAVVASAPSAKEDEEAGDGEGGPTPSIDFSDVKQFVMMCIPRSQSQPIQCYIKRCRTGLQKLWPYYDPDKFLLSGRRRKKNKQSTYLISTDEKDLSRKSSAYTGKVKSNFVGTEFTIYDNGVNPADARNGEQVRCEMGVVQYDRNVLGTNGPRKMQVYLPKTSGNGVRDKLQPTAASDKMSPKIESGDHNYIKVVNKAPRWNENLGAFCLNFQGRVTVASVKNFQLVDETDQDRIVLQFGKCSDDTFTMDYSYPLCALQAFAICLSSFDHKLACE